MNSSIENRIKLILAVALSLVVLMGSATLYYFAEISRDLEQVIGTDIELERSGQQLKHMYFDLKNVERLYLYSLQNTTDQELDTTAAALMNEKLKNYFDSIGENLDHYKASSQNRDRLLILKENLSRYYELVKKADKDRREDIPVATDKLGQKFKDLLEQQDKIINQFLSARYQIFQGHQNQVGMMLGNAKRNIFLLISLAILAAGLIIYLAPQRVLKPIHIYVNALRELKDLKFDVRLPISQDNELAELGSEINGFIDAFLEFDTMKVKKIQFEKRKLQVLSDILNLGVIIISIEGDVLFMNAQIASFLKLSSENFQKKDFHFVRLPDELKELFEEAISKKEKFENRMIVLTYSKLDENGEAHDEAVELLVDAGMVRNYVGEVANVIFTFEDISNPHASSIFKRVSFHHKEKLAG